MKSLNLRNEVVLNIGPSERESKALKEAPRTDGSTAEILRYESDEIVISAYAEHAGMLVLTDTFYPGWSAYVDGKLTRIFQADGLVRALYLDEGEHVVEFNYFPDSFRIGLEITIVSVVGLLVLFVADKLKLEVRRRTTHIVSFA
jgi:uncharacterized membrane protein YfhO